MVSAEIKERYELVKERIQAMASEDSVNSKYKEYFDSLTKFILYNIDLYENNCYRDASMEKLQEVNENLYSDLSEKYDICVGNPDYMDKIDAGDVAPYLLYLYGRIRNITEYVYKGKSEEITVLMELFAQVYNIFEDEEVSVSSLKEAIYYFAYDYADVFAFNRVKEITDVENKFYINIVMESDLDDLRYLYQYGRYISDNELKIAEYLNSLSQDEIDSIARTYTEGYRKGFIAGKKDLSIKDRVSIGYAIGFERVVKSAISQFDAMGVKPVMRTIAVSSTAANKQYSFDHKFDQAVYFDKAYSDRELAVMKTAFEEFKESERKTTYWKRSLLLS